jgi:hypothetical protein
MFGGVIGSLTWRKAVAPCGGSTQPWREGHLRLRGEGLEVEVLGRISARQDKGIAKLHS